MADYSALKATIDASINTNGQQAITGAILNDVLNEMVDVLGEGYAFLGVATPTTNPTTPEGKAYYLAGAAGTYSNFGNIVVASDEVALLVWGGTAWSKVVTEAASKEEVSQLGQKVDELSGGVITEELGVDDYYATAATWTISSNKVSLNTSPSNPNARALAEPIHLKAGDYVNFKTAVHSIYGYLYIVADGDDNVLTYKRPDGDTPGIVETLEYIATAECYLYINAMITKTFECVVTKNITGRVTELENEVDALSPIVESDSEKVSALEQEVYGEDISITDTDYSTFEITHNYFDAGLRVVASARYDMTGYIPVQAGYQIIISGKCDPAIAMVAGYTDNAGAGATALLIGIGQASNEVVTIPDGINYVRCCARNTNFPNVTNNMDVTLRAITGYYGITQKIDSINKDVSRLTIGVGNHIVVPKNKKILLVGASFTIAGNGWDKLVQDALGVEVINKAVGATNIISNVASLMLDADSSKPHGSLFMVNGVDIFDDVAALIIHHVHNKNVLLEQDLYEQRDVDYYKTNGISSDDYASGFDYVIKQYRDWCNGTESITETSQDVTRSTIFGTHPCQIMLVSHWLPSRAIYNESSRQLAARFNLAYAAIDTAINITADDKVYCTTNTDAQPTPTAGYYNPSVLMAQYVNVSGSNPIGKTEVIDGVTWGWHPLLLSSTRDYGFGTMVNRQGTTQYVPYIQRVIAAVVTDCIKTFDVA